MPRRANWAGMGENTLDGFVCPFCGIAGFEDGIKLHTGGMLVFHWGQDAHLAVSYTHLNFRSNLMKE